MEKFTRVPLRLTVPIWILTLRRPLDASDSSIELTSTSTESICLRFVEDQFEFPTLPVHQSEQYEEPYQRAEYTQYDEAIMYIKRKHLEAAERA